MDLLHVWEAAETAWVPRLVSCRHWRRATLLGRSSIRSMKTLAQIFSTILAKISVKVDETSNGCVL